MTIDVSEDVAVPSDLKIGARCRGCSGWSIDLEVPDGVWNAGPTQIIFYQAPSFSLHNTPALRPGQTHIVIELKIPALSDALLEYGHRHR